MIGKYPKCYNRYIIHNKIENVINKHKSNKIKENSNTVRHLNNGTDHRHSKSCCDQSSPARRTMKPYTKTKSHAEQHNTKKSTMLTLEKVHFYIKRGLWYGSSLTSKLNQQSVCDLSSPMRDKTETSIIVDRQGQCRYERWCAVILLFRLDLVSQIKHQ